MLDKLGRFISKNVCFYHAVMFNSFNYISIFVLTTKILKYSQHITD